MSLPRTPQKGGEATAEKCRQPFQQQSAAHEPEASSQRQHQLDDNEPKLSSEIFTTREIKLPTFWRANPALWFAQCECSFNLNRITSDETRFRHVIVNLDNAILPFISDILMHPPVTEKYLTLKTRILQTFGDSVESKLRRLLRENEFRDEKPSLFLHRLRNLAENQCSDTVLRTIFLEQLPEGMRSILAISEVADLSKLAQQADKIAEVSSSSVNLVSNKTVLANKDCANLDLVQAIDALSKKVDKLRFVKKRRFDRSRSRSSGRLQHFRRSPESSFKKTEENPLCFYHRRFSSKARKCISPCSWVQQNLKSNQEN